MRYSHFTSAGARRRFNRVAVVCDVCEVRCPDVGSRGLHDTSANVRAETVAMEYADDYGWQYVPAEVRRFPDGLSVTTAPQFLCPSCRSRSS